MYLFEFIYKKDFCLRLSPVSVNMGTGHCETETRFTEC